MKEDTEKVKLREAYMTYSDKITHRWSTLIKKYRFDNQTALSIIANFWYEPDNAEKFEEEWMNESDKIKDNIEKQFSVTIEHEEECIIVRSENFVYNGNLVIEEDI